MNVLYALRFVFGSPWRIFCRHKVLGSLFILLVLVVFLGGSAHAFDAVNFYPDMEEPSASVPPIVSVASGEIGNDYQKYCDTYGYDHVAWCSLFVSWCAQEAGYGVSASASCSELFNSNGGRVGIAGLSVGDILFFDWDGVGNLDHVGIVSEIGNTIITIEGNVDDTVKSCAYNLDDPSLYGYIRPVGSVLYASNSVNLNSRGNVGTTNQTLFQGLASKISPLDNYVFARTDDNQYIFAWGDLELSEGVFTGSVTYSVYERDSSYSSDYHYSVYSDTNFTLDAGNYVVFSDLGNYPAIGGVENARFEVPFYIMCFVVCGLMLFLMPFRWRR